MKTLNFLYNASSENGAPLNIYLQDPLLHGGGRHISIYRHISFHNLKIEFCIVN